ncbi:MAG: hypothetical protein ACYCPN_01215 [Thermoplasmata archaeon]
MRSAAPTPNPRPFPWRTAFFALVAVLVGVVLVSQAGASGFQPGAVLQTANWYQVNFPGVAAFPTFPTVIPKLPAAAAHTCASGTKTITSGSTSTFYLNATSPTSTVCGSSTLKTFYIDVTLTTSAKAAAGTYTLTFTGRYTPLGSTSSLPYSVTLTLKWTSTFTSSAKIDVYLDFGVAKNVASEPTVSLVNAQVS